MVIRDDDALTHFGMSAFLFPACVRHTCSVQGIRGLIALAIALGNRSGGCRIIELGKATRVEGIELVVPRSAVE
jgi:hypothetical protein